jgi:hypothetical protein
VSKQHARILINLHNNGSVAVSELSDANLLYLRPLLETGVLLEKRKGRGLVIAVANVKALEAFIEKHFPHGLEPDQTDTLSRSQAVSYWRNSKHGDLESEPVFISAKKDCVLTRNTEILPVGQMTDMAGIASFLLGQISDNYWHYDGSIALIENYESFVRWQEMNVPADIAIWTAGRISRRMINWLNSQQMQKCKLFHCGDYDPVGLDEFCRLHEHIGHKVQLYIPSNIEMLFCKYSNSALLQNNSSAKILERLRSHKHPDVIQIVKLVDTHNAGLEQEILLKR